MNMVSSRIVHCCQIVYAFWALIAGTDVKQFLAEARQDVYTPYGEWVKEGIYFITWFLFIESMIKVCFRLFSGWYKDVAKGEFVKILSYNILAQNLLNMHPHLYENHDKRYLDWEYRKQALLKEFQQFDPDVISFTRFLILTNVNPLI